jgi:hypothetical protein
LMPRAWQSEKHQSNVLVVSSWVSNDDVSLPRMLSSNDYARAVSQNIYPLLV